ncbi:MAG: ribosomal protein S18-alanine N-acetyltransferase [Clostridiales bacterium]|jgi:ribosomal-protein-alanine N-acetyltransferase|nr:ribosomal protein S18-alanine N-acetyltransferase [Clostridiales bacterium]
MVKILPMKWKHIEQVTQIETDSFSIPWTRHDFEKELRENKLALYFVAADNSEILGYAGMWHVVNEGHVTNVAVKPANRRQGVGDLLLSALEDTAREKNIMGLTLEVRMFNSAAQRLYYKHGFKIEGFRKNYYADTGEDAIIMWKYL